jgi:hypothetical protein
MDQIPLSHRQTHPALQTTGNYRFTSLNVFFISSHFWRNRDMVLLFISDSMFSMRIYTKFTLRCLFCECYFYRNIFLQFLNLKLFAGSGFI